jgi:uncharacterized protein
MRIILISPSEGQITMKHLTALILFIIICPVVLAQTGTIKLLALSENLDGTATGTLASLSLEVRSGNERVFLETLPLAKVETQISMRFAQQVACKELRQDCSNDDFIYTIVSSPGLVGGPSAGAAAAVLTASLISDLNLREDMAITGTINSGGLIGPVGGIKEKIEAAGAQGIRTVLLPKGTKITQENNKTLDLDDWGRKNNVTVMEVATLDEAIFHFTGKNVTTKLPEFKIDPAYEARITTVAQQMCDRTRKLEHATESIIADDNISISIRDSAANYSRRSQELLNTSPYSAASYCFRANVELNDLYTRNINLTRTGLSERIRKLFFAIGKLNTETESRKLETITDLQTYLSVQERLLETADTLVEASDLLDTDLDSAGATLAYAEERLVSARSWSSFFGLPGQKLVLDQESLRRSCLNKISEAEERFSYVRTYFPDALEDTGKTIDHARRNAENKSYALCLGEAARAKAEADVILSATGFEEDQVEQLIALKLSIAQRQLAQAEQDGDFPLVGYNYYQYANDLKDEDHYSALLFSEYAIELSNLDMYFKKERSPLAMFIDRRREMDNLDLIIVAIVSMAAGATLTAAALLSRRNSASSVGVNKPSPTSLARRRRGKKR